MTQKQFYMELPFDLSGSRSKNRFRNEILWGLEKIFEVYKTGQPFMIVFDYVCDIELHLDNSFEFYQIKTHNNASPYTLQKILKPDNTGKSVLGKLYLLKHIADGKNQQAKVAIVSNTALKDSTKKLYSTCSEKDLASLGCECKKLISDKLKKELNITTDINLSSVCYIYTSMDLFNPQDSLLGQTVNFFIDVKGSEPKKPKALFIMLSDTIAQKASYELECSNYDELLAHKGITNNEIDIMLDKYADNIDVAVSKSLDFIYNTYYYSNYKQYLEMRNSLSKMVRTLLISRFLKEKEAEIALYIRTHNSDFDMSLGAVIDTLSTNFADAFPIEYTATEIKALILLILMRHEEGVYE